MPEKCPFRAPDRLGGAAKRRHTSPFEWRVERGLGCSGESSAGEVSDVVSFPRTGDPEMEILVEPIDPKRIPGAFVPYFANPGMVAASPILDAVSVQACSPPSPQDPAERDPNRRNKRKEGGC